MHLSSTIIQVRALELLRRFLQIVLYRVFSLPEAKKKQQKTHSLVIGLEGVVQVLIILEIAEKARQMRVAQHVFGKLPKIHQITPRVALGQVQLNRLMCQSDALFDIFFLLL
jgi:hypothetical protein